MASKITAPSYDRVLRNGRIEFYDNDRHVASWSGYTNCVVFHPENGTDDVRVGFFQPERLDVAMIHVQRLRNLEQLAAVRKALEDAEKAETRYRIWCRDVADIVFAALGAEDEWDWPSRDCFDAGLQPWEAAEECIRVAMSV